MRLIIDIPEELKQKIDEGFTNQVIIGKLWEATKNGTPTPDNATNGDMIKAMFPSTSLHISEKSHTVWVGYEEMSFRIDWWNAPYQEGGKEITYDEAYDNYLEIINQKGGKE